MNSAVVAEVRGIGRSFLNTAKDLETSSVLTFDPRERHRLEEEAARYRKRAETFMRFNSFGGLRRKAIRVARESLRQNGMDEQTAMFDIMNTAELEPWLHFSADPEDSIRGAVRFAAWQLGERY